MQNDHSCDPEPSVLLRVVEDKDPVTGRDVTPMKQGPKLRPTPGPIGCVPCFVGTENIILLTET